ncbi:dihydroorotate dehydrogenase [Paenibacillus senegalensis]|uniref:dihydroorotate dehydrogenase n=1 Tax=Paenibacillus senegalensis TaxID=1465766 RepID=UPI0002896159|nr:dihydroorotate dehydrogenase [Paenibacillus senegalensis]
MNAKRHQQESPLPALDMEVRIGSLTLSNPIMPASGAFGEDMDTIVDFNRLGAVVPKSITKHPRKGNATPRVCETSAGMINSIGIQSKGIDYYLQHTIPYYRQYDVPLIASISADSVEEFAEMAAVIGSRAGVSGLELNISCPNLKGNGQAFGLDPEITCQLVGQVKQATSQPIIVKLSPNVTSIQEIALAAEQGGADALNVANTVLAMAIDVHTRRPKIGNVMGGLSGPAVKPIIVRMIYQVSQVTKLPIIGCGGVMNGEDVIEMMLAGATAVQVGTASFIKPTALTDILDEIQAYMRQYGITSVRDLIGGVVV